MVTKIRKVLGLLAFVCSGEGLVLTGTVDFNYGTPQAYNCVFAFLAAGLVLALLALPTSRAKTLLTLYGAWLVFVLWEFFVT